MVFPLRNQWCGVPAASSSRVPEAGLDITARSPAKNLLRGFITSAHFSKERTNERLRDARVTRVAGFHVPQLVRFDGALLAIEMSIVMPPFVLDFAGAYLDSPPKFSNEIWADWQATKRVHFGTHWEKVLVILNELRRLGIHMLDPSPSNIRFQ